MHMATILLVAVTLAQLLQPRSALTTEEFYAFGADPHTEQNTGLQGTVTLTEVIRRHGSFYNLQSNGIPDHDTGIFPVPGKGGNNHPIIAQDHTKRIPIVPKVATDPGCLTMGAIAFAKNGVPIFNALDSKGEDAVRGERFDDCSGHPNKNGAYHYHQNPACLDQGPDAFIGVALDGFPIYGKLDCNGNYIDISELDDCHGRFENGEYRYRITDEFPYTLGCFKGERIIRQNKNDQRQNQLSTSCDFLKYDATYSKTIVMLSNANVTTYLSCP